MTPTINMIAIIESVRGTSLLQDTINAKIQELIKEGCYILDVEIKTLWSGDNPSRPTNIGLIKYAGKWAKLN